MDVAEDGVREVIWLLLVAQSKLETLVHHCVTCVILKQYNKGCIQSCNLLVIDTL